MAEAMLRILDRARRGAGVGRTRVPPRQAVFVARERGDTARRPIDRFTSAEGPRRESTAANRRRRARAPRRFDWRRPLPGRIADALDVARRHRAQAIRSLYSRARCRSTLPPDTAETRVIGGGRGTWWEQTHLRRAVRDDSLDVFFAPAYTAPLGTGLPLALTIHDISFVAHPEWFRASEGLRRRWLTRRGASMASVIFTDSEFSRSELERYLRVDPSRIQVIPPGTTAPASVGEGSGTRPRAAGAVRRLPLQPATAAGSHRRLRARDDGTPAGAARHRRRQSHLAAAGSARHRSGRKAWRREPSFCSYIPERRACVAVRARIGVCVLLGVRGLRADAARSDVVRCSSGRPRHARCAGGVCGGGLLRPAGGHRGGRAASRAAADRSGSRQARPRACAGSSVSLLLGRDGGADAVASERIAAR